MKLLVPLLILFTSLNTNAQKILKGRVYLYNDNGKNSPLNQVGITNDQLAQPTRTDDSGNYILKFDNSVEIVKLTILKPGYEVINTNDLQAINVTENITQNIYLDIEGNTLARQRKYQDAALKELTKQRNIAFQQLNAGGITAEKAKNRIEKSSGRKFNTIEEVKQYVFDQYGIDTKNLESILPLITQQNLDHSNKIAEQIKNQTLKGNIDSAIRLVNMEKDSSTVAFNNKQVEGYLEQNKNIKQNYIQLIPSLILKHDYNGVDRAFQIIINADSTDLISIAAYGAFLLDQGEYSRAIYYFKNAYYKTNKDNQKQKLAILEGMAICFEKKNDFNECLRTYDSMFYYLPHAFTNDSELVVNKVEIFSNYGQFLAYEGNIRDADRYLKQGHYILDSLYKISPEVYLTKYINIMQSYGYVLLTEDSLLQAYDVFQKTSTLLDIRQSNTDNFSNVVYSAQVYDNLGVLSRRLNKPREALHYYKKAITKVDSLIIFNPMSFLALKAKIFRDYGLLKLYYYETDSSNLMVAEHYLDSAINILETLCQRDSIAYMPDIAADKLPLAEICLLRKDSIGAKALFDKAKNIYDNYVKYDTDKYKEALAEIYVNEYKTSLDKSDSLLGVAVLIFNDLDREGKFYNEEIFATALQLYSLVNIKQNKKEEAKRLLVRSLETFNYLDIMLGGMYKDDIIIDASLLAAMFLDDRICDSTLIFVTKAINSIDFEKTDKTMISKVVSIYSTTGSICGWRYFDQRNFDSAFFCAFNTSKLTANSDCQKLMLFCFLEQEDFKQCDTIILIMKDYSLSFKEQMINDFKKYIRQGYFSQKAIRYIETRLNFTFENDK